MVERPPPQDPDPIKGEEIPFPHQNTAASTCFTKTASRSGIQQHCVSRHVPRNYVGLRYPFSSPELEVMASRDKVAPRDLPLRPGILILCGPQSTDAEAPSGLNWYSLTPPPIQPAGSGSTFHLVPSNRARDGGPNHPWTASSAMHQAVS